MFNAGTRPPLAGHHPLPHEPQAHFYGLPSVDLNLNAGAEPYIKPGERGYFCGFDTLVAAGDWPSQSAENVLLVGCEGGLEVFRLERDKMDNIGHIEGLGGAVIGAKILPWPFRLGSHSDVRPLVGLVIHGPVVPEQTNLQNIDASSSALENSRYQDSGRETRAVPAPENDSERRIAHYQTTVEVYSLKTAQHITTLYKGPVVPLTHPVESPLFEPPAPIGDIRVEANGKFVVVVCGSTGELFVFTTSSPETDDAAHTFWCVAKFWTTSLYREQASASGASNSSEAGSPIGDGRPVFGVPLFSLSHRWLAIVPPASSSIPSLNGTPLLSSTNPRPPGISTHIAPPPPSVNCAVDTPGGDGFLNRFAREVTQEVIKGAQWLGDQGMQAWRNYWNKPAQLGSGPYLPDPLVNQPQPNFPPTHGHQNAISPPTAEPAHISIYDLQKLVEAEETRSKVALNPLATFAAPLGCSFLSFSPTGLQLLSVSKKGDCQFVWDLMRMRRGKGMQSSTSVSSLSPSSIKGPTGPHVRQIALFKRMTVANVIDVVWTTPQGSRLAVLTERGTVHVFELPPSAFQWPPPRRTLPRRTQSQPQNAGDQRSGGLAAVSSAMQAINGKTRPLITAVARKRSNSSGFPTLSNLAISPAVGAKGGKVVAAGLTKSLGVATDSVNNFRHAGDNKLHLHGLASSVFPGCVRWMTGRDRGSLVVVAGGILRIYAVKRKPMPGKPSNRTTIVISKTGSVGFVLPPIANPLLPPSVSTFLDHTASHNPSDSIAMPPPAVSPPKGHWTLRTPQPSNVNAPSRHAKTFSRPSARPHNLSFAEIDSNPPYQPFHTDRRVALLAYVDPETELRRSDASDATPWVFGEDIPGTRLHVGAAAAAVEEPDDGNGGVGLADGDGAGDVETFREGLGQMESTMVLKAGDGEEVEQVVVTTRRRRRRKGGAKEREGMEEDDGFFEDDCEVLDFADDRV